MNFCFESTYKKTNITPYFLLLVIPEKLEYIILHMYHNSLLANTKEHEVHF